MEKPILYTCSLCKLQFPSSTMRYAYDGKKLICAECFNKEYKKNHHDLTKKEKHSFEDFHKPSSVQKTDEHNSILVICTHCRYKFHYKTNFKPICPYCGKTGLRRYGEFTAQRLINEVAEGDF